MRWYADFEHPKGMKFIIDHDENVGFYVYGYENPDFFYQDLRDLSGLCISHQYDYLQDTLEQAKGFSFRKFQVPMDSWRLVDES